MSILTVSWCWYWLMLRTIQIWPQATEGKVCVKESLRKWPQHCYFLVLGTNILSQGMKPHINRSKVIRNPILDFAEHSGTRMLRTTRLRGILMLTHSLLSAKKCPVRDWGGMVLEHHECYWKLWCSCTVKSSSSMIIMIFWTGTINVQLGFLVYCQDWTKNPSWKWMVFNIWPLLLAEYLGTRIFRRGNSSKCKTYSPLKVGLIM